MSAREKRILSLLEPAVRGLGFDLWGLELQRGKRTSLLRVFIDAPQGVQVEDCARVSEQVGMVLEVEEVLTGEYTLEVSSPGIDRRLFSLEQYSAYVGEMLEVKLRAPFEGRRKFKGVLRAIEGDDIVLHVDENEYLLPYTGIDRANVIWCGP
ncbi:MAG: ribosome maturation factor RimP [Pseudomonadota bacterium]